MWNARSGSPFILTCDAHRASRPSPKRSRRQYTMPVTACDAAARQHTQCGRFRCASFLTCFNSLAHAGIVNPEPELLLRRVRCPASTRTTYRSTRHPMLTLPTDTTQLRDATDSDLPAIQAIYAHHVLTGVASFEEIP